MTLTNFTFQTAALELTKDVVSMAASEADLPAGNPAALGARNDHAVLAFDAATDESVAFTKNLPSRYDGRSLTVNIEWMGASATSGNVVWNAQFGRLNAGGTDLDSDIYAAIQTATGAANGTSGIITTTQITFTQAQADSVAAGESFRLKLIRDADDGSDTMTGDAQVLNVYITF